MDGEATGLGHQSWSFGFAGFAGQVLELFEAPTLLFEKAILAVANQVLIPGVGAAMALFALK